MLTPLYMRYPVYFSATPVPTTPSTTTKGGKYNYSRCLLHRNEEMFDNLTHLLQPQLNNFARPVAKGFNDK